MGLLSRSDSGIRFLCLAATLCTLDRYDAADRLDTLLHATAKEDQIRPTIKQLQVMMEMVKTKMVLSEYAKVVAGWEIFARAMLVDCGPDYAIDIAQIPSKTSLQDLVLALNELGRIGELYSTDIKLKAQQLPWTGAFIQWCLGVSPTVRTSSGKSLLLPTDSFITLTVMPSTWDPKSRKRQHHEVEGDLEVAVQKPLRTLKEIVFLEDPESKKWAWEGLVDARTWVQVQYSILYDLFPEIRQSKRLQSAIGQGLDFIVAIFPERLLLCDDYKALRIGFENLDGRPEYLVHALSPEPFLNNITRLRAAESLLNDHIKLIHEDSDFHETLQPKKLAETISGACRQCTSPQRNSIVAGSLPCRVNLLLELIGTIGSTLLILTLFGAQPEAYPRIMAGLKFDTSPFHHRLTLSKKTLAITNLDWARLVITGWQALMHGKCQFLSCPPIALFKSATRLMGHQKIRESTIVSSKSGQVIYPAFFEANDFMQEGFMQLCAFPGKLRKDDMDFDVLIDAWSDTIHTEGASDYDSEEADSEMGMPEEMDVEPGDDNDGNEQYDRSVDQNPDVIGEDGEARREDSDVPDNQGVEQVMEDLPDAEADGPNVEPPIATSSAPQTVPIDFSAPRRRIKSSENGMEWKVAVQDELLRGEIFLKDKNSGPILAWSLIESLARCRLSQACKHKSSRRAGEIGAKFTLSTELADCHNPEWPYTLFDVGRSYPKQLTFLEQQDYYPPTLIHADGCIGCALRVCRDGPCRVLIS